MCENDADVQAFLSHPLVTSYWPSEQRAMLVHRWYLSIELKRQATVEETVQSWEKGPSKPWRKQKMLRDAEEQIRLIEKHKYLMSERCGHDVGIETAALDWVRNHAAAWRASWENRPDAGA